MIRGSRELCAYIDLPSYLELTSRGSWHRAAHLDMLCAALHDVDAGTCKRLIVNMPPRHGKSEVISKGFPGWYLGRHPDREVMLISYGADLAEDFSRINREKIREYGEQVFGIRISRESGSVARWGVEGHRGGLIAAGVNGPLTGRGASVAVIDDPIKGSLEANSNTYRQHLLEWYQTVLRTRLTPDGAIILVQTRWHKNDLAGWLIDQAAADGEQWRIINMPAISGDEPDSLNREPGQALWPDRFPLDHLQSIRKTLSPYQWSALYQQQPTDIEGAMWKYDTIDQYRIGKNTELPHLRRIVVGVDPAVTATDSSDETGIITAGVDSRGHYYILSDVSAIRSPLESARAVVQEYWLHKADDIVAESNQGGDMVSDLIRTVDRRPRVQLVRATRGKRIRAEPIASLYEQGLVHHVGQFPQLEEQLCTWNPLSNDSPDRMDALVWAVTSLSGAPVLAKPILSSGGGNIKW